MKANISMPQNIFDKYGLFCKDKGYCMSKRIVLYIEEDMKGWLPSIKTNPNEEKQIDSMVLSLMNLVGKPIKEKDITLSLCLTLGEWGVLNLTEEKIKASIERLHMRGEIYKTNKETFAASPDYIMP